jgi:hypothetical protein
MLFSFYFNTRALFILFQRVCVQLKTCARSCGSEGEKNVFSFAKIQEQNIESLRDFTKAR